MSSRRYGTIERNLHRAEWRWKWLRFLQHTLTLGAVLSFCTLFFGMAIVAGWVTSRAVANVILPLLGIAGMAGWVIIAIAVFARRADRGWVGAALERVDHRLLDRLNTLLFLERGAPNARVASFSRRIAGQAQTILTEKPPPSPFRSNRALTSLVIFLAVLGATFVVYAKYSPLDRLAAGQGNQPLPPEPPEKPPAPASPETNRVERAQAWGEVRILDPGTDLKVTKVDVVPLRIEAAASRTINEVAWFSAINGKEETRHALPAPAEPQFGVYEPALYLDELRLSDWDVLSYYATAFTDGRETYGSEVYFLEVRPFREDILKMPGGEGGKPYQTLSDMSALINRQQDVIRETHQHVQRPPEQANVREQDRKKLAAAEYELGESARHLCARMASEMADQSIGEALDNLAKAGQSLKRAGTSLETAQMSEAQRAERGALAELIAARKVFQQAVSDNPRSFDERQGGREPAPVADTDKKLREMAEFRNEAKAARDFVEEIRKQQEALRERAKSSRPDEFPGMAGEQRRLRTELDAFQDQHPRGFQGVDKESREAGQAMGQAAESLHQADPIADARVNDASEALETLAKSLDKKSTDERLADTYRLRRMLDQHLRTFAERAQPGSEVPNPAVQGAVEGTRQTVEQLKRNVEEPSLRDAFKPAVREALSDANKSELDGKLERMRQAENDEAKQHAARELKEGLERLGQAFDRSAPQPLQTARETDPLKQGERNGLEKGVTELESLIRRLRDGTELPAGDQAKQGRQALANLEQGMRNTMPGDPQGGERLRQLQEAFDRGAPYDPNELSRLLSQIKRYSFEKLERMAMKEDKRELANIDTTRLPPDYRSRVQAYFQRLSDP
jgi:hypothetical protein